MGMGRGSAISVLVLLCFIFLHSQMANAATYTVGDASGWTFNAVGWPKGKRFRAGDTLVFNYSPAAHNVVAVNKVGYDTCRTPRGSRVYSSGKDQIKLVRGQNYFICNFPGHCESSMKIAVNAV
ncbi:basic blue protein-like [Senna tora]|uniref:Basic blue protein n=1 Tax=Senna tora TaxID=362788 RepID=A0A834SHR5_9FABA|nr:basic blue protein-like [Senna tora]